MRPETSASINWRSASWNLLARCRAGELRLDGFVDLGVAGHLRGDLLGSKQVRREAVVEVGGVVGDLVG